MVSDIRFLKDGPQKCYTEMYTLHGKMTITEMYRLYRKMTSYIHFVWILHGHLTNMVFALDSSK